MLIFQPNKCVMMPHLITRVFILSYIVQKSVMSTTAIYAATPPRIQKSNMATE